MKESKDKLITKSLTLILPTFFLLFWTMLHNNIETNHSNLVFHINNGLVVLVAATLTFLVVMKENFNKVVIQAKLEQQNKDYSILVKYFEERIIKLTEKCGIAEEKKNILLQKIKCLNQLTTSSDLALYLIEKVVTIAEQYKTDFNIEITGSLDSLKNTQVEDLKQSIEMMLTPIYNNFNSFNKDQHKGDINLFIIEKDEKIEFKIMHDYIGNQINTEMLQWSIQKLLHKYKGNFTVENDQEEEDLNVLTLTVDIPKENMLRKCKLA